MRNKDETISVILTCEYDQSSSTVVGSSIGKQYDELAQGRSAAMMDVGVEADVSVLKELDIQVIWHETGLDIFLDHDGVAHDLTEEEVEDILDKMREVLLGATEDYE